MTRTLLVVPTAAGASLARTCLGLVRALDRRGVNVAFVKVVAQPRADGGPDRSIALAATATALRPPDPLSTAHLEQQLGSGGLDAVLEKIVAAWQPVHDRSDVVVVERYVAPLAELRRHKGWTEEMARDHLTDPIMVGTMMLKLGEVDGMVADAVHTTAATVRPALQILGTRPGSRLVSSVFFMCLPDQVVVYGDCAINPRPDAEGLADIAIQSAASARAFGVEPPSRDDQLQHRHFRYRAATSTRSPRRPGSCANANPVWPSTARYSTTRPSSHR